jgi:hypothetical protein
MCVCMWMNLLYGDIKTDLQAAGLGRRTLVQARCVAAIALVDADLRIGAGILRQQPEIGSQHVARIFCTFSLEASLSNE